MALSASFTEKMVLTSDLTPFSILPDLEDNPLLSRPTTEGNPFYLEGSYLWCKHIVFTSSIAQYWYMRANQCSNKHDNMSEMLLGMSRTKVAQESLNQRNNKSEKISEMLLGLSGPKVAQESLNLWTNKRDNMPDMLLGLSRSKIPRELQPALQQTRQQDRNVAGRLGLILTVLGPSWAQQQIRQHGRNVAGRGHKRL